jgi:hypothetical protein
VGFEAGDFIKLVIDFGELVKVALKKVGAESEVCG